MKPRGAGRNLAQAPSRLLPGSAGVRDVHSCPSDEPDAASARKDLVVATLRLFRYDDLLETGWSARAVRDAVGAGTLVRVRHGVYAVGAAMRAAFPADRVVARAEATQLTTKEPLVFSHETAAALHGLAVYSPSPDRVHTIARPERPGRLAGVIRHRGDVVGDVVVIEGVRCTGLAQTVADVARTATWEQAVVVADAAVRRECTTRGGEHAVRVARRFWHPSNRSSPDPLTGNAEPGASCGSQTAARSSRARASAESDSWNWDSAGSGSSILWPDRRVRTISSTSRSTRPMRSASSTDRSST